MLTLQTLYDFVYAGYMARTKALTAVSTLLDTDVFYVIENNTTEKKITGLTLKSAMGTTIAPASTTQYKVPQWASSQKTLVDGLTVETTVRDTGSTLDTALATEKAVRAAIDANVTKIQGGATGVVAWRYGATATEGYETRVVDKTVSLGAIAGVAVFTVPTGSLLRSVQANVATHGVAGGTSVSVGLGIAADPNAYGATGTLAKNQKIDTMLTPTVLVVPVPILAYPCAADGSIGNFEFTDGTIRVRIVYDMLVSLDNVT